MKKLLKSGICGSVNSASVHYSRLTWSNSAAKIKIKIKKKPENAPQDSAKNAESKRALNKLKNLKKKIKTITKVWGSLNFELFIKKIKNKIKTVFL